MRRAVDTLPIFWIAKRRDIRIRRRGARGGPHGRRGGRLGPGRLDRGFFRQVFLRRLHGGAGDLGGAIALRLRGDRRIADWTVESENFESIHNHSAYALIEGRNV